MDISSVMGFTGFGKPQKAARKFDLDAIFEKTKREAKIIISHNDSGMHCVCVCVCVGVCVSWCCMHAHTHVRKLLL